MTEEHNRMLGKPLGSKEIQVATEDLPNGKAAGPDGIPVEFFKILWVEVREELTIYVNAALGSRDLGSNNNRSNIVLLPKGGPRHLVVNWRPIAILNAIYKIVAKSLANRMQPFLQDWVKKTQTGFVKGRCILDNVLLAYESMNWALESDQDLVLLLLDFEKAYNRISWTFLEETLVALGFSSKWISWVQTLYCGTEVSVLVNGVLGEAFELQRSVRQGCPLAPYLFILATDVLGHMLEDPKYNVQGFRTPKGNTITSQMFADDTAVYLQGSKENLNNMMVAMEVLCKASGAKINWHKSRAIWASNRPRT